MASGWNLWVWLECIGVVIIIITFPYSTCISSFFGSSIPISLFIFKMFFRSCTQSQLQHSGNVTRYFARGSLR